VGAQNPEMAGDLPGSNGTRLAINRQELTLKSVPASRPKFCLPDYESEGRTFESFRARHLCHWLSFRFPLLRNAAEVLVCSWFANFVRSEFPKFRIAASDKCRVRAKYFSMIV
jgi:hypothetical protein